jgi:hypothetical protein
MEDPKKPIADPQLAGTPVIGSQGRRSRRKPRDVVKFGGPPQTVKEAGGPAIPLENAPPSPPEKP